jgi:hypothetical protein
MLSKAKEDAILELVYTSPALLHSLVKKCHNEDYEVPAKLGDVLEKIKLTENGKVPANIKQFILDKATLLSNDEIMINLT